VVSLPFEILFISFLAERTQILLPRRKHGGGTLTKSDGARKRKNFRLSRLLESIIGMQRNAIGICKSHPLLTAAKKHGCFCGNGNFKFLFSSFLTERTQVVLPPRFLAAGR